MIVITVNESSAWPVRPPGGAVAATAGEDTPDRRVVSVHFNDQERDPRHVIEIAVGARGRRGQTRRAGGGPVAESERRRARSTSQPPRVTPAARRRDAHHPLRCMARVDRRAAACVTIAVEMATWRVRRTIRCAVWHGWTASSGTPSAGCSSTLTNSPPATSSAPPAAGDPPPAPPPSAAQSMGSSSPPPVTMTFHENSLVTTTINGQTPKRSLSSPPSSCASPPPPPSGRRRHASSAVACVASERSKRGGGGRVLYRERQYVRMKRKLRGILR